MKTVLTTAILLITLTGANASHPVSHIAEYPALGAIRIDASYGASKRDAPFFYGHTKELRQESVALRASLKRPMGKSYCLTLFAGHADMGGRGTVNPGAGMRFQVSGDLGGDLVITPHWIWSLGVSASEYRFAEFRGESIDMGLINLSLDISVSAAREFGPLRVKSGLASYYLRDYFKENRTGSESNRSTSGISPYAAVFFRPGETVFFGVEYFIGLLRGVSLSSGVAF